MKKFLAILVIFLLFGCLEKKDISPPAVSLHVYGEEGENGWYRSNLTIIIKAHDNESKIKEIKYRIDGGIWKEYVTPIRIYDEGIYFIEYYAMDSNGNKNYKNETIKIDMTKPEIKFSNFEAGYIYFMHKKFPPPRYPRDTMIIGKYDIEVDASDALSGVKKVEFYLGKSMEKEDDEKPYEWEIRKAIGIYNITAVAYDFAGNYNEVCIEDVQIICFG